MKPEIIHLSESLLMIDLPVGAYDVHYYSYANALSYISKDVIMGVIPMPPGEYEIVGTGTLSSDLAEEIAALFDAVKFLPPLTTDPHEPVRTRPATLEEVIESKGFHLRNPYGKSLILTDELSQENVHRLWQWQAAEAKTLKNPVFIKIIKP